MGWQWPRVVTPPAWFGLPGGSLGLGNLGWVPCTPRPRGACAPPGPGACGVGRGLRGAAPRGAQRLRRDSEVQNVCGQPAQLPDACKGSSWGRGNVRSPRSTYAAPAGAPAVRRSPTSSCPLGEVCGPLPTFCSPPFHLLLSPSFPPSPLAPQGSINPLSSPWKGKLRARVQRTGNGRVRTGQPGSKIPAPRLGAREGLDGVAAGGAGPQPPPSASSALPAP